MPSVVSFIKEAIKAEWFSDSRANKTSSRRDSDTSSLSSQAPHVEKASSYASKLDHSSLLSYGAERYYADEKTFLAALKLFNIKLELGQVCYFNNLFFYESR